jgi:hypothetical protein
MRFRIPSVLTRARGLVEGWPLRFLAVVFGLALAFRVGVGWARSVLRPGSDTAAGERAREAPSAGRPAAAPQTRAEANGVATVAAILTGRARALGSAGGSTARRTDEAKPAPTEANRVATRESAEPAASAEPADSPSPSFQRARREFEHRHHDTAPPRTAPSRAWRARREGGRR